MREILLATGNPGKAKEMQEILSDESGDHPPIRWRSLSEFADRNWPEPVEDGETFMANAEIKARHYASLSGMWTIADDSGLAVDALGGEPGVRSARYAGEPKNDAANNALLISKLFGVPAERRTARFCCAMALAGSINDSPEVRILARAEGTVEGRIVDEPKGSNGFGYDPHFLVPAYGMTAAQMEPDMKHSISHRGQALRNLRGQLAALVSGPTGHAPG